MAGVSSPEDVVNEALRAIGFKRRVASLYEGSPPARAALEVYSQTRDEILRAQDWPFARGAGVPLTLLKGPPPGGGYSFRQPWSPVYPPSPWLYEYAYPADCLDLLSLQEPPAQLPMLDPQPVTWRIDNDLTPLVSGQSFSGPPQKVILTNVASVTAVYRRRVTNPVLWQPDFVQVLVEALARKLAMALPQSIQLAQTKAKEAAVLAETAEKRKG